jgi:lanosterol synthase
MAALAVVEPCEPALLRAAGCRRSYELMVMDDENTSYQTIAPVGKMVQIVARFHADGKESYAWKQHEKTRADYMWLGPEGMRVTGTNGSQLWDTVFITQALAETRLIKDPGNQESMLRALKWLDEAQMTENPKHMETAYRHGTKGAWGFRY